MATLLGSRDLGHRSRHRPALDSCYWRWNDGGYALERRLLGPMVGFYGGVYLRLRLHRRRLLRRTLEQWLQFQHCGHAFDRTIIHDTFIDDTLRPQCGRHPHQL